MEIIKGYLETTMFNLYLDENRPSHAATRKLFDAIKRGEYDIYTSQYVVDELEAADEPKRTDMLNLITEYNIKVIDKSDEIVQLAKIYIDEHDGIPEKKFLDALHIAASSIESVDYLFSCNFKHINKLKTKKMVARVNLREGYEPVIICKPEEVVDNES
jgi:predicted nucleic acid-binding protein